MDGRHAIPIWNAGRLHVLSPYAKAGYISKTLHSHVSLFKFYETIFGLKNLNARDAAADGMPDCFDFTQKPLPPPSAT
jgi:phospholipase C